MRKTKRGRGSVGAGGRNTELCPRHPVFEGPAAEPSGGCISRVEMTRLRARNLSWEFIPLETKDMKAKGRKC